MSKVIHGLAFARVTSCSKTRANKFSYSLSNGTTVIMAKDRLCLGSWYFFHLRVTAANHYEYVSHQLISKQDGEEFALKQRNLEQYAAKAEAAWSSLEQADKAVIAKTLGASLSGVAAAGFLADAATTIAVEGLTGIATGGLSLVFGGCLGVISAIAWEDRVNAVKQQKTAINTYTVVQKQYERWLNRLCPMKYMDLEVLDPQLESLVLRMKKVFTDYQWSDICGTSQRPLTFNLATA